MADKGLPGKRVGNEESGPAVQRKISTCPAVGLARPQHRRRAQAKPRFQLSAEKTQSMKAAEWSALFKTAYTSAYSTNKVLQQRLVLTWPTRVSTPEPSSLQLNHKIPGQSSEDPMQLNCDVPSRRTCNGEVGIGSAEDDFIIPG